MWRLPASSLVLVSLLAAQPDQAPDQAPDHVHTDRSNTRLLPLPRSEDVFHFVIYGDRTGGPAAGIKVLEQAVKDTNLLDPDLVMTVGDLVQGYNETPGWLKQMREFKGVMNRLRMPWYPVAGNHDIYWRSKAGNGKGRTPRPEGEHERNYETHFGPLWYAFEHKNCWFVVLFSDEGDPKTGEKAFKKPAAQKMSPAQHAWLEKTLERARDAHHVFVFLHHPRWRKGRYGEDWDRVHATLAAAGNVTAVFAGHIHQMTYSGTRDGIQYYTLATTGGGLKKGMPERAGFLHHQNLVSVRKDRISVTAIPVGVVLDPTLLTEEVNRDMHAVRKRLVPAFPAPLALGTGGSCDGLYTVEVHNPVAAALELNLALDSGDPRFSFRPDHRHVKLEGGATKKVRFHVRREGAGIDSWFRLPRLVIGGDYLAKASGLRLALTEGSFELPVRPVLRPVPDQPNGHLALLGRRSRLELAAGRLELGKGPFCAEAFLKLPALPGRRVLFSHAGGKGFELYLDGGQPRFRVGSGPGMLAAEDGVRLEAGRWHHLAGVWDGAAATLYLDGEPVARASAKRPAVSGDRPAVSGDRPAVSGGLRIGAGSTRGNRRPRDFLGGLLDEVRLSATARYRGRFAAPSRVEGLAADRHTLLLLHLDRDFGPWVADCSGSGAHPRRRGKASCVRD